MRTYNPEALSEIVDALLKRVADLEQINLKILSMNEAAMQYAKDHVGLTEQHDRRIKDLESHTDITGERAQAEAEREYEFERSKD